ncbi:MAG: metalloregulator ArsR/SmtB family transcription factor [Vagococcus sp.]|uniref:ArsR/SmtB family transcription factor n=1 Tax=Vagococcus sp. TaxID=1933889 RepID=UPI002FC760C4
MTNDICEITCLHEDRIEQAKAKLTKTNTLDVSLLFKVLADENRLKILYALGSRNDLCVCDIANIIDATVANTSHHLQTLKKMKLVDSKKIGKLVYYYISNSTVIHLIETGIKVKEDANHE